MEDTERHRYLVQVKQVVKNIVWKTCGGENNQNSELKDQLTRMVDATISIAKQRMHDIEVRVAPAIYNRYRNHDGILMVTSDLGLIRCFPSARALGLALGIAFEDEMQGMDCRCSDSGFLLLVTPLYGSRLRFEGKLPCPHCSHWAEGTKGLWWHVQQQHGVDHAVATSDADRIKDHDLMIIPYGSHLIKTSTRPQSSNSLLANIASDDPFEQAKRGDLSAFQRSVQLGFNAVKAMDKHGASVLLWAAGGGYLPMVRYLVEDLGCDPEYCQQGRRAFRNRTALHWACRNGHLPIVEYLVETCGVDIEAKTGDGTTAFCWASWQNHRHIMEYMALVGCNRSSCNSYGCNAALWAAQGDGDIDCLVWLEQHGCPLLIVNANGHSILHKAAQRGRHDICQWFLSKLIEEDVADPDLIGPDAEGCVASNLARMEGYDTLADFLLEQEVLMTKRLAVRKKIRLLESV